MKTALDGVCRKSGMFVVTDASTVRHHCSSVFPLSISSVYHRHCCRHLHTFFPTTTVEFLHICDYKPLHDAVIWNSFEHPDVLRAEIARRVSDGLFA